MQRKIILIGLALLFTFLLMAQEPISREEYIKMYAPLAMKEMQRTGVPASITLAQGCLESNNGNSTLARDGKNHFGIKCHDWSGRKIYHDDDEQHECFRKYRTELESYIDHSDFLATKARYAELFELKSDDYKGWAHGLKKAGYATSNKYAPLLIQIIEENDLQQYDLKVLSGEDYTAIRPKRRRGEQRAVASHSGRKIMVNNGIEYTISMEGDTPELLRAEMDMYPGEIRRYNELSKGAVLDSGMIVYLQPKKSKAEKDFDVHVVEEGETMWVIAQMYGLKLKSLYKLNNIRQGEFVEPGTSLQLRRRVREEKAPRLKELPLEDEPESDEEMEFEFDG